MRPKEARLELLKRIRVTRQLVAFGKAFLLGSTPVGVFEPAHMLANFARKQGYEKPGKVVLHPDVDLERQLIQASGYLACELALAQALLELIGAGAFTFCSTPKEAEPCQAYTTVPPQGGGGENGTWQFPELTYARPDRVVAAPCWDGRTDAVTDPDLYVLESGVEGAAPEVVEALKDAVDSLRVGLHRPAVVMLGKAMEGAWIELGLALAATVPPGTDPLRDKLEQRMKDTDRALAPKVNDVKTAYERRDLFSSVIRQASVTPNELAGPLVWSDTLREARNAIHFGKKPQIANTYEGVAVLLLAGAKNLGILYRVKRAADQLRSS